VQQHAVEVLDRAIAEIEVGLLVAQRRRRTDQRLDGIEDALDVLDAVDPEPLDQLGGIFTRNALVGDVGDRDDGGENRQREKQE
jgi:hypothetical protein